MAGWASSSGAADSESFVDKLVGYRGLTHVLRLTFSGAVDHRK